jgi:hypothetical protein
VEGAGCERSVRERDYAFRDHRHSLQSVPSRGCMRRAAFGIAARRLAECAERVPADARIAVLVVSDDTRTPPFYLKL